MFHETLDIFKLQAPECDTAEFDKDSFNIRDWCSENKLFSVKSQENQTIVSDLTTTKPMVFRNWQITVKQFHPIFAEKGTNSC